MKYAATIEGQSFEIEVDHDRLVWVNGRALYVELEQVGGLPVYSLALEDEGYVLFVEKTQDTYQVEVQGKIYPVEVALGRPHLARCRTEQSNDREARCVVYAPLAGRLVTLQVAVGELVEPGQVVALVESMKMQMELKTAVAGMVEAVHRHPQQDLCQGEKLVTIRPEP